MINHPNRKKKSAPKTASVTKASRAPAAPRHDHEIDYQAFRAGLRTTFDRATAGQTKVFQTDATGLWQAYLRLLPKSERQIHDCSCCRHFIERFGGLVCISDEGVPWSAMWNVHYVPPFYAAIVRELKTIVEQARPTRVFYTRSQVWGTPVSPETDFEHLCVVPMERSFVYKERALSPGQASALVRENVKTVEWALTDYGPKVLDEALRVLATGTLERSEKFTGPIQWLRKLHDWPKGTRNQDIRNNILLRAVAMAPEGFCHIKSSVVGPLLDDIKAGLPFHEIERRHREKLHPLKYQRPQAAPAAGNVAAAEKLVDTLGIEPSLHRRYARFDELPYDVAIWIPKPYRDPQRRGGVFGHIATKNERRGIDPTPPSVKVPPVVMTWDKFLRTVIAARIDGPDQIEILVPSSGGFVAMVTATNSDAPPILKWDWDEERNPFSTYTYVHAQPASSWNLVGRTYVDVTGIFPVPCMWGSRPQPHLGNGAMFVIEGCKDTRIGQGNALFPEILRNELHGARSTIEAYSKKAEFGGRAEASVCGLTVRPGNAGQTVRTRQNGGAWNYYTIDRWD